MGCGPIEYLSISAKAGAALAAAKQADAERAAPYEYTAAEAFLAKAREEAGYSQYEKSIEFGRRAEALANRALALAKVKADQAGNAPPIDETAVVPAAMKVAPPPAAPPPVAPAAGPSSGQAPAVDTEQPRKR